MKRIILIGSSGKMGTLIKANLDPNKYSIVYEIDKRHRELPHIEVDAVVDFSLPEATIFYAPYFIQKGVPYIIGTTGLSKAEQERLAELAAISNSHLRMASNFDLGFNTLLKLVAPISRNFASCTIEEWHHISKKDIPSGTALSLRAELNDIKINTIAHRTEEYHYRHSITFTNASSTIRLLHEVRDKRVYIRGLEEALSSISLPGFFLGL